MKISDEVVEVALKAMRPLPPIEDRSRRRMVEVILEAAAPHLMAAAWDEGYTTGNAHNGRRDANPYRKDAKCPLMRVTGCNSERDDLARLIHKALGEVTGIYDTSQEEDCGIADMILAAGYRMSGADE